MPERVIGIGRNGRSAWPEYALGRRMYENYLLDAEAIAALLNNLEGSRGSPIEVAEVEVALRAGLEDPRNHPAGQVHGIHSVHGAHVLEGLLSSFTEARHEYIKTQHGEALTRWLIENRPEALSEVAALLRDKLEPRARKTKGAAIA